METQNNEKELSKRTRIIMTVFLIAAIPIIVAGGYSMYKDIDWTPDIIILPDKYKGKATIVFAVPNGVPEKNKGERRVFEMPATGILYTQARFSNKAAEFFFRVANDSLVKIPEVNDAGDPAIYTKVIMENEFTIRHERLYDSVHSKTGHPLRTFEVRTTF